MAELFRPAKFPSLIVCVAEAIVAVSWTACGVVPPEEPARSEAPPSQGVLRIVGEKSSEWPVAERPKARHERVRNVILVSLDTLRRDYVSAYGGGPDVPAMHSTPEMDRLAKRGVLFLDAMANAPSTGISHHAMFMGLPPPIGKKTHFRQVIGGDVAHPLETLQAGGIRTAAFTGDGQMSPLYGWSVGFDEYSSTSFGTLGVDSPVVRELDQIERQAFTWLNQHHEDRFFPFLHTYEVHCPYWPPPAQRRRYLAGYKGPAERIECVSLGRNSSVDPELARRLYAGGVSYADRFIGRLWAKLERIGRTEDTMLIVTSDHGEDLGEDHGYIGHGRFHWNVMKVPLIVYSPDSGAAVASAPAGGVDVIATVYAALGLDPPYSFMGRDLMGEDGSAATRNPPARLRLAHQGDIAAVYRAGMRLLIPPNSAPELQAWTGTEAIESSDSEMMARMKLEYEQLLARRQQLATKFRVVHEVTDESDDPARRAISDKLRSLGYIQ